MPGEIKKCSSCGTPLNAGVAGGLCPKCVFARMAGDSPAPGATTVPGISADDFPARYKLREEIGAGGFGVVYAAEQTEPIRRRVAIKVVKVGMDTRQVVARFEAERQALALMAHPNIAQVFDAGATASGRPFFVMELVRGHSLTKYCDEHQLGTRERLKLLQKVCHAVQHAHHKGIIHRDLKPSNILVAAQDGAAEPKVIDFGIAKATQLELTDKTLYTQFQQFIGTPAYMSPEQAGLGGLDVDARTDVYSLGALLYELLTGAAPFDSKTLGRVTPEEACRLIREVEPPKPSTRLSRLTPEELDALAARHSTDTARLRHALRGDLDRVVMKAMEKDRTRRYATAAALAEDLQRHLDGEPVSAHAPSLTYLAGKFAARHRVAFGAGVAVAASLVLGTVVSVVQAIKASRAQQRAVSSERTATNAVAQLEQFNTRLEHDNYRAAIQLAHARIRAGEPHAALPILTGTSEKLRGWEWGYLMAQCPVDELNWDTGHGEVTHVEPLADERRLLTAGVDWRLALWDIAGRRKLWETSLKNPITEVSAAPDGRHAAVVTTEVPSSQLTVLDLASGRIVFTHRFRGQSMTPVWTDAGLFVAGYIGVWRVEPEPWRVTVVSTNSFGRALPSAKATAVLGRSGPLLLPGLDRSLMLLEPLNAKTTTTLLRRDLSAPTAFLFDPSSQRLTYALDRVVWTRLGEAPPRPVFTNDSAVRYLQGIPGTDSFAVAGQRVAALKNDGSLVARWAAPFGVNTLALAPDGRVIVGDGAGFVRFYQPEQMNRAQHLVEVSHGAECRDVSFSPRGDRLAFMDWGRRNSEHLSTANFSATASIPPSQKRSLATPDESATQYAVGDVPGFHPVTGEYVTRRTNHLEFYDTSGARAELTHRVPVRGKIFSVAFARSNQTLVVSHALGLDWMDLATGKTRAVDFPGNTSVPVALSADGAVAAMMARKEDESHVAWRAADDHVLWRKPVQGKPVDLALHPSGKFLALLQDDGRVELWDIRRDLRVQELKDDAELWGLRFAPHGDRLLGLSKQRVIHFWDWRHGGELLRLRTSYIPADAQFSPNGLMLAVPGFNPGVTVHRAVAW